MTRRARPLAIRLFAATFLLAGLSAFIGAITDLDATLSVLRHNAPGFGWTRDMAIVFVSARLSIAVIPVALVWFLASRFARWMAVAMALGKLIAVAAWQTDGAVSPGFAATHLLSLFAAACLLAPGASQWFKARGRCHAQTLA